MYGLGLGLSSPNGPPIEMQDFKRARDRAGSIDGMRFGFPSSSR